MPRYPGDERPLRGHHPRLDVTFEEIGILFEERGRRPSPARGEEAAQTSAAMLEAMVDGE